VTITVREEGRSSEDGGTGSNQRLIFMAGDHMMLQSKSDQVTRSRTRDGCFGDGRKCPDSGQATTDYAKRTGLVTWWPHLVLFMFNVVVLNRRQLKS